jgi:hypothetical protein
MFLRGWVKQHVTLDAQCSMRKRVLGCAREVTLLFIPSDSSLKETLRYNPTCHTLLQNQPAIISTVAPNATRSTCCVRPIHGLEQPFDLHIRSHSTYYPSRESTVHCSVLSHSFGDGLWCSGTDVRTGEHSPPHFKRASGCGVRVSGVRALGA